MSQSASSCPANHAAHVEVLDLATRDQAFHVSCIGAVPRFTCELRRRCSSDCHLPLGPERDKATYKRMAETLGLESKIDAVQARINRVESKQERVESALEGNGSYLGTTDYDELTTSLQFLRKKGEQLQDEKLILLRQQEALPRTKHRAHAPPAAPATHPARGLGEPHESSAYEARTGVKRKSPHGVLSPKVERRPQGDPAPVQATSVSTHVVRAQQRVVTPAPRENPQRMLISVRDQAGAKVFLKARPTSRIGMVKRVVGDVWRTGPGSFRVDGRICKDEDTLADLGVEDGDIIDFKLECRGGKPVILLYPPAPVDSTVALELSALWSFSALYPKPVCKKALPEAIVPDGQTCEWSVHASPDGSLRDLSTGREYPYLFWEADSTGGRVSQAFGLDNAKSFCVAGDAAGVFLDEALERLGLNVRERCDMITYWLPQLESSPFNAIYFVETELYEKAARLTIEPAPDVTIRVFMAFRGVDTYDTELDTAQVEELRAPTRKGFVAVEWGGMNLNGIVQQ